MTHDSTRVFSLDHSAAWSPARRRLLTHPHDHYDLSDFREVAEALSALARSAERPFHLPDPTPAGLPDPRAFALQLARARS